MKLHPLITCALLTYSGFACSASPVQFEHLSQVSCIGKEAVPLSPDQIEELKLRNLVKLNVASEETAMKLAHAGFLDYLAGDSQGARQFADQAIAMWENLAPSRQNIAHIWEQGQSFAKENACDLAEKFLLASMHMSERNLGVRDAQTTGVMRDLVHVYSAQSKLVELDKLTPRLMSTWEASGTPEDSDMSLTYRVVADAYYWGKQSAKAESWALKNIALLEQNKTTKSDDLALALDDLATIYFDLLRFPEGQAVHDRAQTLRGSGLAPSTMRVTPPSYDTVMEEIKLKVRSGDNKAALTLAETSLRKLKQLRDAELDTLNTSATKLGSAKTEAERASTIEIMNATKLKLDILDAMIARLSGNIGEILHSLNRYAQAGNMYELALSGFEKSTTIRELDVARIESALGILCRIRGDKARALRLQEKAITRLTPLYGENFPDVVDAKAEIALLQGAER